ncbi:MAG: hypothetical protein WCG66_03065 [bacterium]
MLFENGIDTLLAIITGVGWTLTGLRMSINIANRKQSVARKKTHVTTSPQKITSNGNLELEVHFPNRVRREENNFFHCGTEKRRWQKKSPQPAGHFLNSSKGRLVKLSRFV